jgi:hypothetical protein
MIYTNTKSNFADACDFFLRAVNDVYAPVKRKLMAYAMNRRCNSLLLADFLSLPHSSGGRFKKTTSKISLPSYFKVQSDYLLAHSINSHLLKLISTPKKTLTSSFTW